jgi:hypothetical protein
VGEGKGGFEFKCELTNVLFTTRARVNLIYVSVAPECPRHATGIRGGDMLARAGQSYGLARAEGAPFSKFLAFSLEREVESACHCKRALR